jgi:hypothetical protein
VDSDIKLFARAMLTSMVGENRNEDMEMLLPTLEDIFEDAQQALELLFAVVDITLSIAYGTANMLELEPTEIFRLEAIDSMEKEIIDNG